MSGVKGKRVLLTGASSGVGRALAVRLAGEGARLAVVARRENRLRELGDELARAGHERPVALTADLGERGVARQVAEAARERLGGIDVLVNNAGASAHGLGWVMGDRDEGRAVVETNLWSPLAMAAAVVPEMLERDEGVVVNVTSLVQVSPFPQLAHYSASKAALAVATETMRTELKGTRVRMIEAILGAVESDMSAQVRELPGGKQWLGGMMLGNVEGAARAIHRAIVRRHERFVYPRVMRMPYRIPAFGRMYSRRMAKYVDARDTSIGGPVARPDSPAPGPAREGAGAA